MADFYEPWRAKKSGAWALSFRCPPNIPEALAAWENQKQDAERNAPWLIWGTGVWEPAEVVELMTGKRVPTDSTGLLVTVRNVQTERGRLDAEAFARRMAACVNFCEGVDLSECAYKSLRDLIVALEEARCGVTRDIINEWWKPKLKPDPVVFDDKPPPQGPKVRKPRHQKPPAGVTRKRSKS